MERVTYLLGAGFSAPLGLPVMRNFLIKSKDLYFSDIDRYKHFSSVFDTINAFSKCKNYYDADLFNIGEILSILEMASFVEGRNLKSNFAKYICDVIDGYTLRFEPHERDLPANWHRFVFGKQSLQRLYGSFVGSILGISIRCLDVVERDSNHREWHVETNNQKVNYSVVSLNYDLVLEKISDLIFRKFSCTGRAGFESDADVDSGCLLAKLHGSADTGLVVPPTWAKGTHRRIAEAWRNAHRVLTHANHIRFIGYSLPLTDSYIQYLLKSAVIESAHLKTIDVVCKDKEGSARSRYDAFMRFVDYRFQNRDVIEYLQAIHDATYRNKGTADNELEFGALEHAHEVFMAS